jgi:hypothetical protein
MAIDKRYQVFVSSTYTDLKEERWEVIQALLELDCIPSGMELFPAASEDQWTLIKKIIDDCDYYLVIIGGRYGSVSPEGMSYTEMEYRYALKSGKPIIGFLHVDPELIPAGKSESTPEGKKKLAAFRDLAKDKHVRHWADASDLGSKVSRSLVQLIKSTPAIGWVRSDQALTEGTSTEILRLKKQVEELTTQITELRNRAPADTESLAQGDDVVSLSIRIFARRKADSRPDIQNTAFETTWNGVFSLVAPSMMGEASESALRDTLNASLIPRARAHVAERADADNLTVERVVLIDDQFNTIKVQLRALGLIKQSEKTRSVKDTGTYWTLTPYGDAVMVRLRAVPRAAAPVELARIESPD